MEYTEYGMEQNNIIIFLHGGGLAPWNFRKEVKQLKDKYYPKDRGYADLKLLKAQLFYQCRQHMHLSNRLLLYATHL